MKLKPEPESGAGAFDPQKAGDSVAQGVATKSNKKRRQLTPPLPPPPLTHPPTTHSPPLHQTFIRLGDRKTKVPRRSQLLEEALRQAREFSAPPQCATKKPPASDPPSAEHEKNDEDEKAATAAAATEAAEAAEKKAEEAKRWLQAAENRLQAKKPKVEPKPVVKEEKQEVKPKVKQEEKQEVEPEAEPEVEQEVEVKQEVMPKLKPEVKQEQEVKQEVKRKVKDPRFDPLPLPELWSLNAPRASRSGSSRAAAAAAEVEVQVKVEQPLPRRGSKAVSTPYQRQQRWKELLNELDALVKGGLRCPTRTCGDGFCHMWAALGAVQCLDGSGSDDISQRDYSYRMLAMLTRLGEIAGRKSCPAEYREDIAKLVPPEYLGVIAAHELKPSTAQQATLTLSKPGK